MSTAVVAKRYALALFDLAQAKGEVLESSRALNTLAEAISDSAQLRKALELPNVAIGRGIIQRLLVAISAPQTLQNLPKMLAKKRRLLLLKPLAEEFAYIADQAAGKTQALVRTAVPLANTEELKERLSAILKKEVSLTIIDEPQLLGGLTISVGSLSWDGSLKRKLQSLQETLR